MAADGTFSARRPSRRGGRKASGPESNTGHKSPIRSQQSTALCAPIIDWCAVTFPAGTLKRLNLPDYAALLHETFGTKGKIALGAITDKAWNFFPHSAVMVDETGTLCGRLGLAENGQVHISLTGQGCKHVWNWHKAQAVIENTGAHLTRVDVAVDDLAGKAINIESFDAMVKAGAFVSNGRPPLCQLVSDYDSGKGKTLYIGQRGYKQLCVYEKGKQLGDPTSDYCRAELRLYNKHHIITPSVLTNPGVFFAGAYEVLAQFIGGEVEKLEAKERIARPTAEAMLENLKRQSGTAFSLLHKAFGDDTLRVMVDHILREGRPGRFKSYTGDPAELLRTHIRSREHEGHHRE